MSDEKQQTPFQQALAVAIAKLQANGVESIDLTPKRLPEEEYTNYKLRQKINALIVKAKKKGILRWNPNDVYDIPKIDEHGKPLLDEEGKYIPSGKKTKLGTYITAYGKL